MLAHVYCLCISVKIHALCAHQFCGSNNYAKIQINKNLLKYIVYVYFYATHHLLKRLEKGIRLVGIRWLSIAYMVVLCDSLSKVIGEKEN